MNPLAADLDHILDHTQGLWEELRGQRLFITGGTGFFGCWLLESFAWANDQLGLDASAVVLTRNPAAFHKKAPHLAGHPAIQFHPGDVRDFQFPEGEYSHVIHAGTTSSAPVEPGEMFDTIVQGTRRVLDFAASHGTRKLLFTSSGAVYGRQPPEMTHVPEDYAGAPDPLAPASAYGEGKRAAELLCSLAGRKHGFETKIARCFAFVGPYLPLDAHFAIGNFVRDGLRGGPIRVGGDGTPYRSYLYAADLAVWLWTVLLRGQSGCAYNVGSDADLTIAQLARLVAEVVNPGAEVTIAQPSDLAKPPQRYVPSVDRARRELGLEPWVPLREGVRHLADWHRNLKA